MKRSNSLDGSPVAISRREALVRSLAAAAAVAAAATLLSSHRAWADDEAPAAPPAGAEVLFDGKDLSKWQAEGGGEPGFILKDGYAVAHDRDIETRQKFGDFKLHVEFDPVSADPHATGEGRGNSGVYLQGRYEIQVLDSFGQKLYPGACASVYGQTAPSKNAARPEGQWQTYDIEFHAARFKDGKKTEDARVTVIWNGQKVQDNTAITGSTGGGARESAEPGPIRLQYHHNPVRFRNIWIEPIEEK